MIILFAKLLHNSVDIWYNSCITMTGIIENENITMKKYFYFLLYFGPHSVSLRLTPRSVLRDTFYCWGQDIDWPV